MSLLDDEKYGDVEEFLQEFGGRQRPGHAWAGADQGPAGESKARSSAGLGRTTVLLQPCSASQRQHRNVQMFTVSAVADTIGNCQQKLHCQPTATCALLTQASCVGHATK